MSLSSETFVRFESFQLYSPLIGKSIFAEGMTNDMLNVTDTARDELQKVLASDQAKDNHLVIYFQGHG